MSGKSQKEKAADSYYNQVAGTNTNVANRFDNYEDQFGFNDMSQQLESIFGGAEDKINRNANEAIANEQGNAASRMASRGITGGSAVDTTLSGVASNINEDKFNALSDLGIGKAGAMESLMEYLNQNKFNQTKAATGVDQSNIGNMLAKLGLQGGALGGLDDTTWLDDILGVVKTGAQSAGGIAQLVTALSDRAFKENIIRVGEKNGIPIYEFNYIGNPTKLRGVMAQELEKIMPDAVINIGGIKFVDYSKIGIPFEEV